jgi:hypothetical protein
MASRPLRKLCIGEIPAYNGFMKRFHFLSIAFRPVRAARAAAANAAAYAARIAARNREVIDVKRPARDMLAPFNVAFFQRAA